MENSDGIIKVDGIEIGEDESTIGRSQAYVNYNFKNMGVILVFYRL